MFDIKKVLKKHTVKASVTEINAQAVAWYDVVKADSGTHIIGDMKGNEIHIARVGAVKGRTFDGSDSDFESITLVLDTDVPARALKRAENEEDNEYVPVMRNTINATIGKLRGNDAVLTQALADASFTDSEGHRIYDVAQLNNLLAGAGIVLGYTNVIKGDAVKGTAMSYEHDFVRTSIEGIILPQEKREVLAEEQDVYAAARRAAAKEAYAAKFAAKLAAIKNN